MAGLFHSELWRKLSALRTERLTVIDAGAHTVKVLQAEWRWGRAKPVSHTSIELAEEGLLSASDLREQSQAWLQGHDSDSVAVVLPQHATLSEAIDLAASDAASAEKQIEAEAVKLSGLSEGAIAYGYTRLRSFGRHQRPCWLTFCQEAEVFKQIDRLGLPRDRVSHVTSTVNGLVAAFLQRQPSASNTILVDLGASQTVFAIILEGQAVYAASLPMGSALFSERIATERGSGASEADGVKRTENLLTSAHPSTALRKAVDEWAAEIARLFREWHRDQPDFRLGIEDLEMFLSGGGSKQPGLLEYLRQVHQFKAARWPQRSWPEDGMPPEEFAAAWGAALQAFDNGSRSVSLLPAELRAAANKRRNLLALAAANAGAVALLAFVLTFATCQKLELARGKKALLGEAQTALAQAQEVDALLEEAAQEYDLLRPVLNRQKHTLDTLNTLNWLSEARGTQSFWYVLLADQNSYTSGGVLPPTNSPPALTNQVVSVEGAPRTNAPVFRSGFVAELCIPGLAEAARAALGQIATNIREAPFIRNVDTLPGVSKRIGIDSNLVVADRHFALTIDLTESDFTQIDPAARKRILPPDPAGKAPPRSFRQKIGSLQPTSE